MNAKILTFDFRLIRKDPMLLMITFVPVIFWLLLEFAFPLLASFLLNKWGIEITPYFRQVFVFFLPIIPLLFGMVYGFILLDERDEGIIAAISVTPYGKTGYLQTRMLFPVIYSFCAMVIFNYALHNPLQLQPAKLLLIAALLSADAPIILLFLGAYAKNKIEGMAITKLFNLLMVAIIIDFIVPPPYNWIGGISPFFWVERAMFASGDFLFWIYFTGAILTHSVFFFWMYRKFKMKSS